MVARDAEHIRLEREQPRQRGIDLTPNEVKQILTMTAEDVLPANTGAQVPGVLPADPAQRGWDQHFGYGRPDLGLALE